MAQGPGQLAAVTLDDKYILDKGRVYLTGTQALVRLPMMQRQRDAAAGLNTGCFISGYRGSPLGGFDQALWSARRFIEKNHIRFQPAINEELAATAVWGSQQLRLFPGAKYDGVFAMWYGKGPGVDRSGDALKHGNSAGSAPNGGVLVLAGWCLLAALAPTVLGIDHRGLLSIVGAGDHTALHKGFGDYPLRTLAPLAAAVGLLGLLVSGYWSSYGTSPRAAAYRR